MKFETGGAILHQNYTVEIQQNLSETIEASAPRFNRILYISNTYSASRFDKAKVFVESRVPRGSQQKLCSLCT